MIFAFSLKEKSSSVNIHTVDHSDLFEAVVPTPICTLEQEATIFGPLICAAEFRLSQVDCQKHYVQLIDVENENGDEMSRTSWPCYVILGVSLQTDDGEDDLKKGTQLLEIYALEIQMYTAQKNNKKLKALYEQSLHIKSAIPHPLIMGVIRGELVHVFPLGMLRLRGLA